ncbi:ABC transporter permease [Sphaerisporangium sp. NPDC051017]|uniref:ABC transporter permease n=1 Tax=Sphaerisporangium sp. NPDC051017 TaxID=3154636 RepID=UPI003415AD37
MTATTAPAAPRGLTSRGPVNPWVRFLARRLFRFAASLLGLMVMAFVLIQLIPGDPARNSLGITASAQSVAQRRVELGLDKSLLDQFGHFVGGVFTGDLGTSFNLGLPVSEIIGQRWAETARLAVLAFLLAVVVAVPLGAAIAAATSGGRRRFLDMAFTSVTGLAYSIPGFLLAVGLSYVFAVRMKLLPIAGTDTVSGYVLPVIALAVGPAAALARIVRLETLRVLGEDFVRTARSKRLPTLRVFLRHVIPNTLTPTLSMGGLMLGGLLAGTILVETIFVLPGLGSTLTQSVTTKDYPMVQALVLVTGGAVLLINLVVDMLIAVADPRSTILEG